MVMSNITDTKNSPTKEIKSEKKIVQGSDFNGLFKDPVSEKIEIEAKGTTYVFDIKPINNRIYAKVGDEIKLNGIDFENNPDTLIGLKFISDVYYPALRVILPECCIMPKFIDGVSTDPNVISVDNLPMEIAVPLFDKLMMKSGLSPGNEAEEQKK